jgi:hypothetical protein
MASLSALAGFDAPFMPNPQEAENVALNATDLLAETGQAQRDASTQHIKEIKVSYDSKGVGTVTLKGSEEAAASLQKYADIGRQAVAAADAQAEALARKRQVLEAHPILAGVGRLASLASAGYAGNDKVGPIIRAAGIYGGEFFGQTPDQLLGEEASIRAGQAQTLGPIEAAEEARARTDIATQEVVLRAKDREDRLVGERRARGQTAYARYMTAAQGGVLPANIEDVLATNEDIDKADIPSMSNALRSTNSQAVTEREDKQAERKALDRARIEAMKASVAQRGLMYAQAKSLKAEPYVKHAMAIDQMELKIVTDEGTHRSKLDDAAAAVGVPGMQNASSDEARRILSSYNRLTLPGVPGSKRQEIFGITGIDPKAEQTRQTVLKGLQESVGFYTGLPEAYKVVQREREAVNRHLQKLEPDLYEKLNEKSAAVPSSSPLTPQEEADKFLTGLGVKE